MAAVKIKIILCVCLAVCLTALGVSGFMLYKHYAQRQNDQNAFEQLDEVTRATNDEAVPDETTLPNTTESTTFDADTAAKVDEQRLTNRILYTLPVILTGTTSMISNHCVKSTASALDGFPYTEPPLITLLCIRRTIPRNISI